jgi:hypothetical protein
MDKGRGQRKEEEEGGEEEDEPGTALGTFWTMMGSRKTVPPRMLRMVPLGDCREQERERKKQESEGKWGKKTNLPHLLKSKLLDTLLVRGDGSAL